MRRSRLAAVATVAGQAIDLRLPDLRQGEGLRQGISGPLRPRGT